MGQSSSTTNDAFDYEGQLLSDKKAQSVQSDDSDSKDNKDCSRVYRNKTMPNKLVKYFNEEEDKEGGLKTIWECFASSVKNVPKNNMLGGRQYFWDEKNNSYVKAGKDGKDIKRGNYAWMTYEDVDKEARDFGSGLVELGGKAKDAIGIYSINRPEWVVCCLGFFSQNMRTVSLYATLGNDAVQYIIKHADIEIVVTEKGNLKTFEKISKDLPKLKVIIQIDVDKRWENEMDRVEEADVKKFANLNIKLLGLSEVKKIGEKAAHKLSLPETDDLAYIMYTSGTTGNPKGAMLRHSNIVSAVAAMPYTFKLKSTDIHVSYLPLAHIFESIIQICIWVSGGGVGFYSGDPSKLTEDCTILKPTILAGVPRVFSKIYQKVFAGVAEKNCAVNWYFNRAYTYQSNQVRQGLPVDPKFDKKIFLPLREKLGFDKVRFVVTGAAPCPPYVIEFLRVVTGGAIVSQGYGMTETAAALTFCMPDDINIGHCGPPLCCTQIKLKDVAEMKYFHTDKPPRGEILVKGPNIFAGYYKNEEGTRETIDSDGWLMTGDIGRMNENGTLSIIDRKKNIFKLSQGEYIAAEKVEAVYAKSGIVGQIWIYGNGFRSFILGVVVPNPHQIKSFCEEKGWWPSKESTGSDQLIVDIEKVFTGEHKNDLKKYILDELSKENVHLKGFEKLKDILIEYRMDKTFAGFTIDNECLTPSFKLRRPQLLRKYAKQLRELYTANGEPPANDEKWPGED